MRVKHTLFLKHPHVRGEDYLRFRRIRRSEETPPRAWGRPAQPCAHGLAVGNTPTCVGKTFRVFTEITPMKKHPHVRGEDRNQGNAGRFRDGNTPTCVGKTAAAQIHCVALQKHPHVRGEDHLPFQRRDPLPETPPRAWGRHLYEWADGEFDRNTPTCVGKTRQATIGKPIL